MRLVFTLASLLAPALAEQTVGCVGNYPGYEGPLKNVIQGQVKIEGDDETVILSHLLAGLEVNANGNLAIYAGTSCESVEGIGELMWDRAASFDNPWEESEWNTELFGFAYSVGSYEINDGEAYSYAENVGKVVVIEDSYGTPVACAVLDDCPVTSGEISGCIQYFPDYMTEGNELIDGEVIIKGDELKIEMSYIVWGLPVDSSGAIALHEGEDCEDPQSIGGHYWDRSEGDTDPWGFSFWGSSATSVIVTGDFEVTGAQVPFEQVRDRVVIITDTDGNPIGCAKMNDSCGPASGSGSGSGSGLGSALPPGVPVHCSDYDPAVLGSDELCADNSHNGFDPTKMDEQCHQNELAGQSPKADACKPICCCKRKWYKNNKCPLDGGEEEAAALPICGSSNPVDSFCHATKRVPNGPRRWNINNCGDYDVFEIKCQN